MNENNEKEIIIERVEETIKTIKEIIKKIVESSANNDQQES